jgi:putative flippase GtrA
MSALELRPSDPSGTRAAADVDIVVPVYNEAEQLRASVGTLRAYLDSSFPFATTITIADNASTDGTWPIARELAETLPGVSALHLDQKGRGRALRAAWSGSTAKVVSYMDVDLATGLDALLPLVEPLLSGQSDLAVGTRLAPGARVVRGTRREFISRGYNLLLRAALRSETTDAQCGFKAMRREIAARLLPLIEDNEWFFDTELLVTAQRLGLRIHEVPVDWVDDTDSRVEVLHTALLDLRGVVRLLGPASRKGSGSLEPSPRTSRNGSGPNGPPDLDPGEPNLHLVAGRRDPTRPGPPSEVFADELLRFAGVGAVSTVAYVALFAALEPGLGSYLANAVAIVLCSLGNTAAHRGMAGAARHGVDRPHRLAIATLLLGVSLAFTTGALTVTRALGFTSLYPELGAVTAANVVAAVIRFGILRTWVFRPAFGTRLGQPGATGEQPALRATSERTMTPS